MSDDRADLILSMLRAIRCKLDEHDLKFEEVITRLGRLERESASLRSEIANLHGDFVSLSERIDNVVRRLARVEHRLDLVDESTSSS
jgi:predicted nuclease with TOPRIM domain